MPIVSRNGARLTFTIALLALLVLAGTSAIADGNRSGRRTVFTSAQRAEIVRLLRDALVADPSILRDALSSLKTDDQRKRQAAADARFTTLLPRITDVSNDPIVGNVRGNKTLVEFYDLQCRYCRDMRPILQQLTTAEPQLRIVLKPIAVLGFGSDLGERALYAAQRQGGYSRLDREIMNGPIGITEESLYLAATHAGLNWSQLRRDMATRSIRARCDRNLALAKALGVDGTPTFVVGKSLVVGATTLSDLKSHIDHERVTR